MKRTKIDIIRFSAGGTINSNSLGAPTCNLLPFSIVVEHLDVLAKYCSSCELNITDSCHRVKSIRGLRPNSHDVKACFSSTLQLGSCEAILASSSERGWCVERTL